MTALDPRTLQSMHHCPVESKIARKIIRDLKKAGNPIESVWYDSSGYETVTVAGENAILNAIFAVDACWLLPQGDGWIFFVIGNGWDAISDYTTTLEDVIDPILDWASDLEVKSV